MNLRTLDLAVTPYILNVFADVAKLTSFATIAGGYLRDSYYRVPHKDIDIFTSSDLDVEKLKKTFSGWTVEELDSDEDEKYDAMSSEFSVVNLTHPNYDPIQIMRSDTYNSVSSVLEKFDFGFCQIAFDGCNVLVTDAFWSDAANNTATFVLNGKRSSYTKHEERLRAKYPDLKWV